MVRNSMLSHLDVFTGIGGFTLAAGWNGFHTVGFSEIDPYCNVVLAERWPFIKNYGDITGADFSQLTGRVTVLTGGFPCKEWSLAGRRGGTENDGHLWSAMCHVIEVVQPRWVIAENVLGLLSGRVDDGEFCEAGFDQSSLWQLDRCCTDLEDGGYAVQPFVIPAAAVGAFHRRERVWIVAHSECGYRHWGWSGRVQTAGGGPCDATVRSGVVQGVVAQGMAAPPACFGNTEPPVCRRNLRASNWAHRIKALGNAVVPKVVSPFFKMISEIELGTSGTSARAIRICHSWIGDVSSVQSTVSVD
jgi:site-specific DNA-cytosine methylase